MESNKAVCLSLRRTIRGLEADLAKFRDAADAAGVSARINADIAIVVPYLRSNMKAGLAPTSVTFTTPKGKPAQVVFSTADDVVSYIRGRLRDGWRIENLTWAVGKGAKPRPMANFRTAGFGSRAEIAA